MRAQLGGRRSAAEAMNRAWTLGAPDICRKRSRPGQRGSALHAITRRCRFSSAWCPATWKTDPLTPVGARDAGRAALRARDRQIGKSRQSREEAGALGKLVLEPSATILICSALSRSDVDPFWAVSATASMPASSPLSSIVNRPRRNDPNLLTKPRTTSKASAVVVGVTERHLGLQLLDWLGICAVEDRVDKPPVLPVVVFNVGPHAMPWKRDGPPDERRP